MLCALAFVFVAQNVFATTYTITYDLDGGQWPKEYVSAYGIYLPRQGATSYDSDTIYSNPYTPPTPLRTGYDFSKWKWTLNGNPYWCSLGKSLNGLYGTTEHDCDGNEFKEGNVTATASWSRHLYTITYNLNGGTNSSSNPSTYTITDQTITLKAPTKTGNTFAGWCDNSALTSNCVTSKTIPTGSYGNKTFYAKWTPFTYSIKFNANGGSGSMSNQSMTYGTAANLKSNTFTKTGNYFVGWCKNSTSCSTPTYTNGQSVNNLTTTNAGTVNLYAMWQANKSGAITLDSKYYATSSTATGTAVTKNAAPTPVYTVYNTAVYKSSTISDANKITALSTLPTYTGYTFGGFYTAKAGTGTQVVNSSGTFLDAAKTRVSTAGGKATWYAKWTPKSYTITYDLNGGGCSAGSCTPTSYTIESAAITLPKPTKTGHTFVGWCDNSALTSNCATSKTIPSGSTGNKTFYAKWTLANYTIILNPNGGSGGTSTLWTKYKTGVYLDEGQSKSMSTTANPIMVPAINKNINVTYKDEDILQNSYDLLFNGYWGKYQTIDSDGYITEMGLQLGMNVSSIDVWVADWQCANITLPSLTEKAGYSFAGWYDGVGEDATKIGNAGDVVCLETDTTMYAKWIANTIKLSWNNGGHGGTAPAEPNKCTYGSTFNMPAALTETGWKFEKWVVAVSEKEFDAGAPNVICDETNLGKSENNATATIMAKWKAAPYTITYNTNGGSEVSNDGYDITDTQPDGYGLATTSKTGYAFDGWCVYDSEQTPAVTTCSNPVYTLPSGTTGNKWAYAKWTPIGYTITYNTNSGKIDADGIVEQMQNSVYIQQYTIESSSFTLAESNKEYYDFDGWCDDENLTMNCDKTRTISTGSYGDKTYYAKWKLKEYTISYHDVFVSDDNSSETKNRNAPDGYPTTYTIETVFNFGSLAQMTDSDGLVWEFGGWFTDEDLTTSFSGISGNQADNIDVYAKWTAKMGNVKFICSPEEEYFKSGQAGTYIDVAECQGGDIGWSCSGYPLFTPDLTKVQVPDGETVCRPGYQITYKGDGIENNEMIEITPHVRLVPDTYTSDLRVVFPSKDFMNGFKLRPGYSFTGWFYNYNNGVFSNATTGIARGSSGNKIVWARWSPNNYNVTYDCASTDTQETPEPQNATYDEDFIVASNTCVKTGYTFTGWLVSKTNDVLQAGAEIQEWQYDEDKTFIAQWTPNVYVFTLDKNADDAVDTGATTTIYEKYGDGWYTDDAATTAISAPDNLIIAPTRDEYVFGGYYRCAQTTGATNCEQIIARDGSLVANVTTDIADNGTLYAKWILTLTCSAGQYYSGTTRECELCEKDNYCKGVTHLMGDNDNRNDGMEECPSAYPNTSETGKTAITDCYATVIFNSNGGSEVESQTKHYSESAALGYVINPLPNSIQTGYTFDGWYQNDNRLTESMLLSGNQTFTAKWELNQYNIIYYVYYYDGVGWQDMDDLTPDKYDITSEAIPLATPDAQDGYVFDGWCIVDAEEYPDCEPKTEFTPTEDDIINGSVELYAKWVDSYNITYVLNGGSGYTSGTYQYGVGLASLQTPTRTHWGFAGWYKNEDLSGDVVEYISDTESGDITLYAKWEFNCESGKWSHIGGDENDKMCLYETKPSAPALKILIDNVPYYAYLSERGDNSKTINKDSTKKLHIQIDDTVYNAHDASVEKPL